MILVRDNNIAKLLEAIKPKDVLGLFKGNVGAFKFSIFFTSKYVKRSCQRFTAIGTLWWLNDLYEKID
ncbi:hypothetical protein COJ86_03665 [Bacillus cereus]|nr:hypothetical protein COJ86_03665 [Bacillus cereus]